LFANRYTAFIDACTLVDVLRRDLLLSLAEAEFFRIRWSNCVLVETEKALVKMYTERAKAEPELLAAKNIAAMKAAFEDAMVDDHSGFTNLGSGWPDVNDLHVVSAALKTCASTIVTENIKHFPENLLKPLNIEARTGDEFIADTIELDLGKAVAVVRNMRTKYQRPEIRADDLLLKMESRNLTATVDILRPYVMSL